MHEAKVFLYRYAHNMCVGALDIRQREVLLHKIGKFCAVLELGNDGHVRQPSDVVYCANIWELGYLPLKVNYLTFCCSDVNDGRQVVSKPFMIKQGRIRLNYALRFQLAHSSKHGRRRDPDLLSDPAV